MDVVRSQQQKLAKTPRPTSSGPFGWFGVCDTVYRLRARPWSNTFSQLLLGCGRVRFFDCVKKNRSIGIGIGQTNDLSMMTCTHLAVACLAMAAPAAAFLPAGGALAGRSLLRPAASSLARPLGAMPSRRTPARGPATLNMRTAPPGVDFTKWDTAENPPAYYATSRAPRYSSMVPNPTPSRIRCLQLSRDLSAYCVRCSC